MGQSSPKNQSVQLELFPTGKTEQALSWRQISIDHISHQDKLMKYCYVKFHHALKNGDYSEIDGVKKIYDSLTRAGNWNKHITEALKLAEESLNNAMIAESYDVDYDSLSEEELDQLILERINGRTKRN